MIHENAARAEIRMQRADAALRKITVGLAGTVVVLLVALLVSVFGAAHSAKDAARDAKHAVDGNTKATRELEAGQAAEAARFQRMLDLLFPPAGSITEKTGTPTAQQRSSAAQHVNPPAPAPAPTPSPRPTTSPSSTRPAPTPTPTAHASVGGCLLGIVCVS